MGVGTRSFTYKSDEDAGSGWPNIVRVDAPDAGFQASLSALVAGDFMSDTEVLAETLVSNGAATDNWVRVVLKGSPAGTSTQYVYSEENPGGVGDALNTVKTAHQLFLPFGGSEVGAIIIAERVG